MHPPRPNTASDRVGFSDQLSEWLLTHCPFSALTLLTILVVASGLAITRLWTIVVPVVTADVVLYLMRRNRRVRKLDRSTLDPRATA